jgi:predicted Zn finger-like uncharacterized protein
MILTCSSCGARFEVDAAQLGPGGRKVRCGRCGHTWLQTGETPAKADASAAVEPIPRLQEFDEARRRRQSETAKGDGREGRRGSGWLGWSLFVLVLLLLLVGLYVGRQHLVALLPEAAPLYQALGLDVARPGEGLDLRDVTQVRRVVNGEQMLLVEGRIVNTSERSRSLPLIRASIIDANGGVVNDWTFEAEAASLPPGGATTFRTSAKDPPRDGHLSLDFVARKP